MFKVSLIDCRTMIILVQDSGIAIKMSEPVAWQKVCC